MAAANVICVTLCCVVLVLTAAGIDSVFISNLDAACMRCICQGATGCNITAQCVKGYCGPFYISRIYWVDADKYVLPEDDPERAGAFHDCAVEYSCAKFMVENYMAKYGRDCNGDGVTDCDDYAMIHYNGGLRCDSSLEGTAFHTRFTRCRPAKTTDEDDELPQGDQPLPETHLGLQAHAVPQSHGVPTFHAAPEIHAATPETQTPPAFEPAPESHAAPEVTDTSAAPEEGEAQESS